VLQLNLEEVRAQGIQVNSGNSASIEATIKEAHPPLVWDVQAEAYQCLCPFQVDGDVLDDGARHCKQR